MGADLVGKRMAGQLRIALEPFVGGLLTKKGQAGDRLEFNGNNRSIRLNFSRHKIIRYMTELIMADAIAQMAGIYE
ncbi:MAG TPA: hypothetical protein VFR09_00410 [Alphaproteobacteria bacterium]|nr:hypothetical protein [Alphaproteobacteria bacterium]